MSRGEIDRLLITQPPRTMKSLTVSVFWPAWEWLTSPHLRYLYVSHSSDRSINDAVSSRRIISSMGGRDEGTLIDRLGYRGLLDLLGSTWEMSGDQNVKSRYDNDERGFRLATSIGGGATGEGGDRVVIDDPHKLEEGDAETPRKEAVKFATQTAPSRLNNARAALIVVQQRVHEEDVAGSVLDQGGWTHLCLPNEYEPSHPFVWPEDPRTEPGELLWPDHFNAERTAKRKVELGSYAYAGQYQQRPAPAEGGMFKKDWWRFYAPMDFPTIPGDVTQSWDMTFKKGKGTDFVVGQVWCRDRNNPADRYLMAQIRARMNFPETKKAVRALTAWTNGRFGPHRKLVEDKANGSAIIADLRGEIDGLIAINPGTDSKQARASAVSPQVESGNVFIPEGFIPAPPGYEPTRTDTFVGEFASFPVGHDDQVDAMSQALSRMSGSIDVKEFAKTVGTPSTDSRLKRRF